jgi:hypothetical protein
MIYKDHCKIICKSYTPRLEITLLVQTIDFRRFAPDQLSVVVNLIQIITFSHQFRIKFTNERVKLQECGQKSFQQTLHGYLKKTSNSCWILFWRKRYEVLIFCLFLNKGKNVAFS